MPDAIAEITIRLLDERDRDAVAKLAESGASSVPPGRLLGGSVDDRLVVAVSLESGRELTNPLARTSEVRALLAERVRQLRGNRDGRVRRLLGRRSHAAPPSTPPRPGGGLHTLPQRAI